MLPERILAAAVSRGLTIACAESVTGGDVVSALIAVPGASDAVAGSAVTYTIAAKQRVLGVPAELMERYGVVSEEVALEMARRALALFAADVAVATTGVAGPASHGGRRAGTVCVGSVGPSGEHAVTVTHEGDRAAVREAAVGDALGMLLLALGETAD
ncbi:CinA family protein [Demequina sp.]|uniref:CinA family protein n=1 Tax=Demequina sp. TaxID=2050685 RepID=UPI003D0DF6A7